MLSDKDRELISIGASIATGCQPCTNFHLHAARIAGASEADIRQAVQDALSVCRHATDVMTQVAAQHAVVSVADTHRPENPLISELVSISAAWAVNSVADLEPHVATAQRLGATEGQILTAIKIAEAVKRTAERKVEAATTRAIGVTPVEDEECGPQCGCHSRVNSKNG